MCECFVRVTSESYVVLFFGAMVKVLKCIIEKLLILGVCETN